MRAYAALFHRHAPSGVLREAPLRQSSTEPLGKLSSLHEKEHGVGGRWSSDRFHLAHAVGTEGIEPHAVLPGYQVLLQLRA